LGFRVRVFHSLPADDYTSPVAEVTSQLPVSVAFASSSQSSSITITTFHFSFFVQGIDAFVLGCV
jgi:hypothetical protein